MGETVVGDDGGQDNASTYVADEQPSIFSQARNTGPPAARLRVRPLERTTAFRRGERTTAISLRAADAQAETAGLLLVH